MLDVCFTLDVYLEADRVYVTATGPSDHWFAVGVRRHGDGNDVRDRGLQPRCADGAPSRPFLARHAPAAAEPDRHARRAHRQTALRQVLVCRATHSPTSGSTSGRLSWRAARSQVESDDFEGNGQNMHHGCARRATSMWCFSDARHRARHTPSSRNSRTLWCRSIVAVQAAGAVCRAVDRRCARRSTTWRVRLMWSRRWLIW